MELAVWRSTKFVCLERNASRPPFGPREQRPQTSLEAIFFRVDAAAAEHLREPGEGARGELGGGELHVDRRIGGCFA
jgi:hypothetical protein